MRQLTLPELMTSSHELAAPFTLELEAEDGNWLLECIDVLRWLPGRRLVVRVPIDGADQAAETQVLKLFIGKGARRYQQRELQGLEWLRDAGQRVPAQLGEPVLAGPATGLLFTFIADAQSVDAADSAAFIDLVRSFADLHSQGIWHEDVKLDNFLTQDEEIWFVDGDAIRRQGSALASQPALENVAMLLAERPPQFDVEIEDLLRHYCRARDWPSGDGRLRTLERALRRARHRRLSRYLHKTMRDCSEFAVLKSPEFTGCRMRELAAEIWRPLLADPNAVVAQGELIKAGNSATVVRWQPVAGVSLIVKRYNVKSLTQAWRRALRPVPRYRRAWQFGHALKLSGVATAQPLVLLERRGRWRRGEAWLVMEDLGDEAFDPGATYPERTLAMLTTLLRDLRQLGIAHGDTKASNFLLLDDCWYLIDLDAMAFSKSGWRDDASRFVQNFSGAIPPQVKTLLPATQR